MLQKVEILESGDTELMPGETLDREEVEIANSNALKASKKVSTFVPVFNGITKVSHKLDHLFPRIISGDYKGINRSCIAGKKDDLIGLKENVIVGS